MSLKLKRASIAVLSLSLAFFAGCQGKDEKKGLNSKNSTTVTNPSNADEYINETPLQNLNWLVGTWDDDEEGVDVHTSWSWDKFHNFLTQEFSVDSDTEEPLYGKQIVGWDPSEEKIRSWIFDSDGGFGEGEWNNIDNKWIVTVVYTTNEGQKASATYIYNKSDDNNYLFSSEGRDFNGEVLPNIGPYKIIRKG